MDRIKLFGILFAMVTLSACEFNQSVNKDLKTGAYSRGNGLGCDEIVMKVNGQEESRNEFIEAEKVNFYFNNITGFKKIKGKAFPGMSLVILSENDTIRNHPDLLAHLSEGTDLSPLQLRSYFIADLPYEHNEKYKVQIKIWDNNGDGTFEYEMPFSIKKNELLTINSQNVGYSNFYLWDETEKLVCVNENVNADNTLILIGEGLDGLEVVDGKVYPVFSIELSDSQGNLIISNNNILEEYEETGVDYEAFQDNQLTAIMTFKRGEIHNPCTLKASLTDLKSDRKLEIEAQLKVH